MRVLKRNKVESSSNSYQKDSIELNMYNLDDRYSFDFLTRKFRREMGEDDLYVGQQDVDDDYFEFGDGLANLETIRVDNKGILTAEGDFGSYRATGITSIEDIDKYMKKWFKATVR
jgi:hypothetical protein